MKQSKQLLFFGILAGGVIGLIVSSPTIYAIVEPHITINMDPGQTTNPFQINDDLGTEVFSIDPNGGIDGGTTELIYEADGPISIPAGTVFPDQKFLAKWKITKPAGALDAEILVFAGANQAEMKRTSSIGFTFLSILVSPDDVTYDDQGGIGTNSDTYKAVSEGFAEISGYSPDTRFIAVGVSNGDAATSGEIQNIKIYLEIILPHGWTIERIL